MVSRSRRSSCARSGASYSSAQVADIGLPTDVRRLEQGRDFGETEDAADVSQAHFDDQTLIAGATDGGRAGLAAVIVDYNDLSSDALSGRADRAWPEWTDHDPGRPSSVHGGGLPASAEQCGRSSAASSAAKTGHQSSPPGT